MPGFIDTLLIVGGLIAGLAVAVMCGVCLLVWLAGGGRPVATEAWRQADKT